MRRFTVRALNEEIGRLVADRYPMVLVEGEVSQVQIPSSGHCYLVLRDDDAELRCVVWRSQWQNVRHRPQRGDRIVARGRVDVFVRKGSYQLYIYDIVQAGEGRWAKVIAERRARLEAEGLLDPRRKRPLPRVPRVVGLATSPTGAALHDFLRVSGERFPAARILLAPCQVQGDHAPASVIRAVELLLEDGRCDVIVVTRGGGSKEDLMPFQDEYLARFLAHCPIPVMSAVGHEIDTTLADLVADAVAPTPSAAAAQVLPDGSAMAQRVDEAELALRAAMGRRLAMTRERVDSLHRRLRHPGERLVAVRKRLGHAETAMAAAIERRLAAERARLAALERQMRALSPTAVLERGYAIVTGPAGVLTDAAAVAEGDALDVRLARGSLQVDVRGTKD